MALERGTRLGLYQIESSIGAGGMGEVYRATDTRLECTVAIKVLPAELIRDKRATPRLLPVISPCTLVAVGGLFGCSQPADGGTRSPGRTTSQRTSVERSGWHWPWPGSVRAPGAYWFTRSHLRCNARFNADGPAGLYRDPNRIQRHTCAGSFTGDRRRIGIEPSRCDRWSHRPRVPGQHVSRPGGFLRLL